MSKGRLGYIRFSIDWLWHATVASQIKAGAIYYGLKSFPKLHHVACSRNFFKETLLRQTWFCAMLKVLNHKKGFFFVYKRDHPFKTSAICRGGWGVKNWSNLPTDRVKNCWQREVGVKNSENVLNGCPQTCTECMTIIHLINKQKRPFVRFRILKDQIIILGSSIHPKIKKKIKKFFPSL